MISNKYIKLVKYVSPKTEGYGVVEVQDNFVYKGKVHELPEIPVYIGNRQLVVGDVVLFAKYSPDTHEVTTDGLTVKYVALSDLLEVL